MKKRILIVICLLLVSLFVFASCSLFKKAENGTVNDDRIRAVYTAYAESGGKLSYEEWYASIKGEPGVGISKIEKTGTQGLVDTYTITLTNGQTSTFTVTNGVAEDKKKSFLNNARDIVFYINLFEVTLVPSGTAISDDTLEDFLSRRLEVPLYNLIDSNDAADFTRNTMKDLVSEEIRIYDERNGFEVYIKFKAGRAYVDEDTFSDKA